MAKIIKLNQPGNTRLGLKRVKKTKQKIAEDHGQLNLFTPRPDGRVIKLSADSAFEEALKLDEAGDLEGARQAYQRAIKGGNRVADAYCNLGIIEFQLNDLIKAIDCFTKTIQQSPRHFQAHYNLANLYSEQKNYDLARFHYQVAIEIAPEFPNAYYNLGLVLALNKDYEGAIKVLVEYKSLCTPEDLGNTDELLESLNQSLEE